jgi:hypothetical protein
MGKQHDRRAQADHGTGASHAEVSADTLRRWSERMTCELCEREIMPGEAMLVGDEVFCNDCYDHLREDMSEDQENDLT